MSLRLALMIVYFLVMNSKRCNLLYENGAGMHVRAWQWGVNSQTGPVNSISISGMLSGQWKVKPRWPPMEDNFGRQFQSSTRACTSVSVSYATFYSFLKSCFSKYTQNIFWEDKNELKNFKYISKKSNRVTGHIFSRK